MKSSEKLDSAVFKSESAHSPIHLLESAAQLKPSSTGMHELIEKARQAKARPAAELAMEIKRRRMDARRKVEEMVATVEFNDPFIDPEDVFMSPSQLKEARQSAADAQAQILALARQR